MKISTRCVNKRRNCVANAGSNSAVEAPDECVRDRASKKWADPLGRKLEKPLRAERDSLPRSLLRALNGNSWLIYSFRINIHNLHYQYHCNTFIYDKPILNISERLMRNIARDNKACVEPVCRKLAIVIQGQNVTGESIVENWEQNSRYRVKIWSVSDAKIYN